MGLVVMFCGLRGSLSAEPPKDPAAAETLPKKGFGIAISPSVIRLSGKPGQSQRATVRVTNNGDIATRVVTEVNDVGNTVNEQGKLSRQYFPPGTLPFSCAKWTLLQEEEFSLNQKESKEVSFLVAPPADSSGGSACVIFFRGIPLAENKAAGGTDTPQAVIQIQPRLGAMIFYEIGGTVKRTGSLLSLAHEPPTSNEPLKLFYIFKNTGNADILITGTFYLLDENKALAAKGELEPVRTFPGDEGAGETKWTGTLAPGHYKMVITFELGPGIQEVIVKELELDVV